MNLLTSTKSETTTKKIKRERSSDSSSNICSNSSALFNSQSSQITNYIHQLNQNCNFTILCKNYKDWSNQIYEDALKSRKNLINILNTTYFNYVKKCHHHSNSDDEEDSDENSDSEHKKTSCSKNSTSAKSHRNKIKKAESYDSKHDNIFESACLLTDNYEARSRQTSESFSSKDDMETNPVATKPFTAMFDSQRMTRLIQYAVTKNNKNSHPRMNQTTNILSLDLNDCLDSKYQLSNSQLESGQTISSSKYYKKSLQNTNEDLKLDQSKKQSQASSPNFSIETSKQVQNFNSHHHKFQENTVSKKDLWKALSIVSEHPESWIFHKKVDINNSPDYFKIIKTPIDLSSIEQNINNFNYHNVSDFIIDVRRIFQNSRNFNGLDSDYWETMMTLEQIFLSYCDKHLNQKFKIYDFTKEGKRRDSSSSRKQHQSSSDTAKSEVESVSNLMQDNFEKLTLTQVYKIIESKRPSLVNSTTSSLTCSPVRKIHNQSSTTSTNSNSHLTDRERDQKKSAILKLNLQNQQKDQIKMLRKQKLAEIAKKQKHNAKLISPSGMSDASSEVDSKYSNPTHDSERASQPKKARFHVKKTRDQMEKEKEKYQAQKEQQKIDKIIEEEEKRKQREEKERKELEHKQKMERYKEKIERERREKQKEKELEEQRLKKEKELEQEKQKVDDIKNKLMQDSPNIEDFSPRKSVESIAKLGVTSPACIGEILFS